MSLMKTLAFLALLVPLMAFTHHDKDKCGHAHRHHGVEPDILKVEEEPLPKGSRFLATATYPNIRIIADYSQLTLGDADFIKYVKQHLLPPVIDYFQTALKVKQPLTSPLKISSTSVCGFPTPSALTTGVTTDFFVIVSSEADTNNWVASAGSCYLASATKRPIIAQMLFNTIYTKAAADDLLTHEKNMYLTMHEMTHALGFAGSNFKNFIDANGNTLTGHILKANMLESTYTVLNVEPLTSKLRAHYGCSTLPGAFMEDDGGAGTEGSHFERRHFLYEVMTSGVIHGRRISEFTLALLEGSGWYSPNYTYAEPFTFGQGQGCNFLYMDCTDPNFKFEEFCTGSNRECTSEGRSGGICTVDTRSDNCSYALPIVEYDCQNPQAQDSARFPELQKFGRDVNSKCFNGNLTTLTKTTPSTFCFKYTCTGSGLSTVLNVNISGAIASCKVAGAQIRISGYNGAITCPDPLSFCTTIGKGFCPRNCLGRGKCVNNQCVCNSGFSGIDCALSSTWGS